MSDPPIAVRPPWPDEIPRLAEAFPGFPRQTIHPLLLLVRDDANLERIVGYAGIFPPIREVAGLILRLRPRFVAAAPVAALLDPAATLARSLGAHTLLTIDELAPENPLVAFLASAGFSEHEQLEVYSTALADIHQRVERIQARLERAGRTGRFAAEPLAESHLPAIRELMRAERLLAAREVTLFGAREGRGYDPAFSFAVRDGDELAGALLARRLDPVTLAVEAEAVAPRWRGGLDLVHHTLFRACIAAASVAGIRAFVYTVNNAGEIDTRRMAGRTGSKLLRKSIRLGQKLA